jgi:2-amino-4-hydroxy-6-hydroxymethyldihydropteridine diphosphokinase
VVESLSVWKWAIAGPSTMNDKLNEPLNSAELVIVALGANLPCGDMAPAQTVQAAVALMADFSARPLLVSPLLITAPVNCPPGSPDFVNAAVAFTPLPGETPESLLDKLQALEHQLGRHRSGVMNEPRVLDLDIIAFGTALRDTTRLSLPHPRARQRRFVLEPLWHIVPDYRFPDDERSLLELLDAAG